MVEGGGSLMEERCGVGTEEIRKSKTMLLETRTLSPISGDGQALSNESRPSLAPFELPLGSTPKQKDRRTTTQRWPMVAISRETLSSP